MKKNAGTQELEHQIDVLTKQVAKLRESLTKALTENMNLTAANKVLRERLNQAGQSAA